ncbi:HGGxSTG domain-containing protein [Silanimonas sp.]|uniref:HGGxSTG domain-containing protein n=1 Tax=Silanimonas sp. TaxID=1929290 RepID=UPI002638835D|nr:HGGxSTG domain-containing protein [Silanimonas sp.]
MATHVPGSQLARAVDQLELAAALGVDDPEVTPRPGERWADVYGRAIGPCGARARSGALCKLPGVGCGGRCKFHGGASTGPRTPAGKARAADNARQHAARLRVTHEQAIPSSLAPVPPAMPDEAVRGVPAASKASAPGSKPQHRRPFLDQVLDDHLAGRRPWPVAARILAVVEAHPKALDRIELNHELGEMPLGVVVDRLIARGALAEVKQGCRQVLVRPRR